MESQAIFQAKIFQFNPAPDVAGDAGDRDEVGDAQEAEHHERHDAQLRSGAQFKSFKIRVFCVVKKILHQKKIHQVVVSEISIHVVLLKIGKSGKILQNLSKNIYRWC